MCDKLFTDISSWEYGILIGLSLTALLLFVLSRWKSDRQLTPLSYMVALAIFALIAFQCSRLVGACHTAHTVSALDNLIGQVAGQHSDSVHQLLGLATPHVGWYIFRRMLWSLLFLTLGGVGILCTMEPRPRASRRSTTYRRGGYDNDF